MIAAYKGTSSRSKITRFVNWSDYSHISWVDPHGWEIEAMSGGVRMRSTAHSDHTPGTEVEIYDVELTAEELDGIREFLINQIGKRYDYLGLLHFVTRRPEYAHDQDRWFCSELVFAAFAAVGKPLLCRIPAYKVYPGMLIYSPLLKLAEVRFVPQTEIASKLRSTASEGRRVSGRRLIPTNVYAERGEAFAELPARPSILSALDRTVNPIRTPERNMA